MHIVLRHRNHLLRCRAWGFTPIRFGRKVEIKIFGPRDFVSPFCNINRSCINPFERRLSPLAILIMSEMSVAMDVTSSDGPFVKFVLLNERWPYILSVKKTPKWVQDLR